MKTIIKDLYDDVTKAHHALSDAKDEELIDAAFAKLFAAEHALHKALGFEGANFMVVTPLDIEIAYAASQQGE